VFCVVCDLDEWNGCTAANAILHTSTDNFDGAFVDLTGGINTILSNVLEATDEVDKRNGLGELLILLEFVRRITRGKLMLSSISLSIR
jgi:hypothetical protein